MATFIPEDKISEIKNAVDLIEVVSEVVLLKKSGRNFLGLCPFHAEKTPSFTVNPEKQIFHCFGCGTGGNVFSFLMKHEGLSFPEAVRMLAGRYGIQIPAQKMTPEQKRRIDEKESILEINRQAMAFYQRCLTDSPLGKRAMAYLKQRGMTDETISGFNLGYAPKSWDNIYTFFLKSKVNPVLVEKSGLIVAKNKNKGFYDRFRDRIIFPIVSTEKRVIGFGGRVMDDSLPKYLNSPETPVYNKSRSLYGLHAARNKIREREVVFIVEGYFDLLSLHQHGIENSVATLGTAITADHIRLMKGHARKLILVFDSDEAGRKAALRSIEIFINEGVEPRILVLPVGHDPDSYLRNFGARSFLEAAENALNIMTFFLDTAERKHGLSTEGKIRIVSDLKEPLAAITDSVARSFYIKEIGERLGIDEAVLLEQVRRTSSNGRDITREEIGQEVGSRLESKIISMMLQFPSILSDVESRNLLDSFRNETLKSIGHLILTFHHDTVDRSSDGIEEPLSDVSEMMLMVDDEEKRRIIAELSMREELWDREGCFRLMTQFESSRNKNENVLLQKIKTAEESKNYELLMSLLKEKQIQARKKTETHLDLSGG